MRSLLSEIERVLPDGGEWTSIEKAHTLASIIVALRPMIVVELGVWLGGSAIPMLLALKHIANGKPHRMIAVDPWSASASIADQEGDNAAWWGAVDHEAAYRKFRARLDLHELAHLCTIARVASERYEPPSEIGLLHIDANHGPQAIRDVERYAPRVPIGGILVMDDVNWAGGSVARACSRAVEIGFRELYPLGTGAVFQRVRIGVWG